MIRDYLIVNTPEIDRKRVLETAVIERREAAPPLIRRTFPVYRWAGVFVLVLLLVITPFFFSFSRKDLNPQSTFQPDELYTVAAANLVLIANHEDQDYGTGNRLMVVDEINVLNFYLRFIDMALGGETARFSAMDSNIPGYANRIMVSYGETVTLSVYFDAYENADSSEIVVLYDDQEYTVFVEKGTDMDGFALDFVLRHEEHEYRLKVKQLAAPDKNDYCFFFRKNDEIYHQASLAFYHNGEVYALLNDYSAADRNYEFRITRGEAPYLFSITYQIGNRRPFSIIDKSAVLESGDITVQQNAECQTRLCGYSYLINPGADELLID
jgi:hypothetical protein